MNTKSLSILLAMVGLISISSMAQTSHQLEPLYGIEFLKNAVKVSVKSTGCTKPEHFTIKTHEKEEATQLEIIRNKPDRCRAMPKIISLELELVNENRKPYELINVFVSRLR